MTHEQLIAAGFVRDAQGNYSKRGVADRRVAASPKRERNPSHEPVGETSPPDDLPGRRLVRIKSYRVRLLDERNLYDKAIVDALQTAGIIRDDSPRWCKVEVSQEQVERPEYERTVIEIEEI